MYTISVSTVSSALLAIGIGAGQVEAQLAVSPHDRRQDRWGVARSGGERNLVDVGECFPLAPEVRKIYGMIIRPQVSHSITSVPDLILRSRAEGWAVLQPPH